MIFGDAQLSYLKLQQRLAVAMGAPVLDDVRLTPPLGDADELSFQRLVAWAYVVLNETGRIPLNFLKELPPSPGFGKLMPHVRDLRTWISHNLALDKAHDRETLGNALLWLKQTCGTMNPKEMEQWAACFRALCGEIAGVLDRAVSSTENLLLPEDGPKLVDKLRKRLSGNWDAYEFDEHVQAAATMLGYVGVDVVLFRNRHLNGWRIVVEAAEPDKRDSLLRLRIEADLLTEMGNALPWPAAQALARAKLNSGAELGAAMLLIREAARNNRSNMSQILEQAFPES